MSFYTCRLTYEQSSLIIIEQSIIENASFVLYYSRNVHLPLPLDLPPWPGPRLAPRPLASLTVNAPRSMVLTRMYPEGNRKCDQVPTN